MNHPAGESSVHRRLAFALLLPAIAVLGLAMAAECWRLLAPERALAPRVIAAPQQ